MLYAIVLTGMCLSFLAGVAFGQFRATSALGYMLVAEGYTRETVDELVSEVPETIRRGARYDQTTGKTRRSYNDEWR